ncbi:MAG: MBL fold metallo-hydrolase [Jiangellales bacterium]
MSATLQFMGGAGTVTGSKFLLQADGVAVLVDAGLFQGLKALRRRNWDPFGFAPADIDAVVLTHAHLDHCGYLPALARQGLDCPVLATDSTLDLATLVLRDSAALQEEDAAYAAKGGWSRHRSPQPLYTTADVEGLLPLMQPVPFGEPREVTASTGGAAATVTLVPAGHILGSAAAQVTLGGVRVVVSGDLGRDTHPLLTAPAPRPGADVVLVESTYGNRHHHDDPEATLADALTRTLGRGGVAVIPAFAVDRTEIVLMTLRRLMAQGRIPRVPVFADSPMALGALDVYRRAVAAHSADIRAHLGGLDSAFDPGDLREVHDARDSMAINDPGFPCIIVSASGMASGGRVVHHLKHLLPDPRNTVVLVGFQAMGTRGRALRDGAEQVKMHGRYVPVRAEVVSVEGFSVHADSDDLIAWLASGPDEPQVVYVVHGEPDAASALASRVRDELGWLAVVPAHDEIVRLP